MLQMRCCHALDELPRQLYDSGYTSESLLATPASRVLSRLNVTEPVSTSSVWDGLRWPTSAANVSLIGSPSLLSLGASHNLTASALELLEATVGASSEYGLLAGAAVDESGCLVLPQRPCLSVLLFWVSPLVTACAGLVAALLCALLGRTLTADEQHGANTAVTVGGRVFILVVCLAAASMWVSASIAGASMGVSKVILQGLAVIIIVMGVLIDRMFGWKAVLQRIVTKEPLARRLIRFLLTSDYSRASVIAVGLPILVAGLLLSVLNQFFRVHLLGSVVLPSERALKTTKEVDRIVKRLMQWNWTSVLRKVVVLTFAYMVWVVGVMKVTTLFFSWLTHVLKPMPLGLTTGVFVGVGMCMFLLPPVPGAPVYMASGVLLTATTKDRFGYPLAALYAMGVAYLIKLGACALQQKAIGANLGRSRRVRSAVMVNTPLMRALKLMMLQPGIWTRGKVATLVGGPDWPISVMMGILGMPLAPVIGGTLPVIFLVAPLSLSGSFMIMGPVSPFPAMTNIALAISSMSQLGAFVAMLHYVERITQSKRDELDAMPYDQEVLMLDRSGAEYAALYAELTSWQSSEVPYSMRALLIVGALLGIGACQVATLFDDDCFRTFSLYPDFPTQLRDTLGGKVSNLIMTPGYGVLGATVLSFLCRYIFIKWANRLVRAKYKAGVRPKLRSLPEGAAAPGERPKMRRASGAGGSGSKSVLFADGLRPAKATSSGSSGGANGAVAKAASDSESASSGGGGGGGGGSCEGAGAAPARKLSDKSKPFWELKQQKEERARQEAIAQKQLAAMAPVLQLQESRKAMAIEAKAKAAAAAAAAASTADHVGLDAVHTVAAAAAHEATVHTVAAAAAHEAQRSDRASKAEATKERPPKQKHQSRGGGGGRTSNGRTSNGRTSKASGGGAGGHHARHAYEC